MARSDPQINFRLPQQLKDKIEAAALNNKRSVTAEVVDRLEQSFVNEDTYVTSNMINELNEHIKYLNELLENKKPT